MMFPQEDLTRWNPTALRDILHRAGYLEENFSERESGRVLRAREDSPQLPLVIRLFANGQSVTRQEAQDLLGAALPGLLDLGLLSEQQDWIQSEVRLEPDGDSWLVADQPSRILENPSHVMGIGKSTRLLAMLAPTRRDKEALDLCTGSGWIAKQLAGKGMRVTACDVNPQAIDYARLGARISGHEQVEFLCGNLFDPVADRQFDLITVNPPFVISPDSDFIYRESACTGSSLCEKIARSLPRHLKQGGTGIMFLSWFDDGNDEASSQPLDWIDDSSSGVWLFRNLTQEPDIYARKWLRDTSPGRVPVESEVNRWVAHFKSLNARRIHTGFLVVHRHDGPRWTRHDIRQLGEIRTDAATDIARVLHGESWLATHQAADQELLGLSLSTPSGLQTETAATLDGSWHTRSIRLMSPARLSYDGSIDPLLSDLLAHCHRGSTPQAWMDSIREQPGLPLDSSELPTRVAGLVRELIRHGILIPAAPDCSLA